MEQKRPVSGELYRHFKGGLYQIITIGKHSETLEEMVVYQALYGNFDIYIRPLSMFFEVLDKGKYPNAEQNFRFEKEQRFPDTRQALEVTESVSFERKEIQETERESRSLETADEIFMKFLDAETYQEKLDYMYLLREHMEERIINNIAASMDLPLGDVSMEEAYEIIVQNLEQQQRFECVRLR